MQSPCRYVSQFFWSNNLAQSTRGPPLGLCSRVLVKCAGSRSLLPKWQEGRTRRFQHGQGVNQGKNSRSGKTQRHKEAVPFYAFVRLWFIERQLSFRSSSFWG